MLPKHQKKLLKKRLKFFDELPIYLLDTGGAAI